MNITRFLGAVVALSIVSACADTPTQPELLDSSLIGAADQTVKMVPWKAVGTSETDPDETAALDCGTAPFKGAGFQTGQGRHVGQYTGTTNACIRFTGPPVDGVLTLLTTASDVVYIAANGDEVWMAMDPANPLLWSVSPWPGDPATQTTTTLGGYNIVGGTGRFEGATGYVTGVGAADDTWTTTGMISSPGSIK